MPHSYGASLAAVGFAAAPAARTRRRRAAANSEAEDEQDEDRQVAVEGCPWVHAGSYHGASRGRAGTVGLRRARRVGRADRIRRAETGRDRPVPPRSSAAPGVAQPRRDSVRRHVRAGDRCDVLVVGGGPSGSACAYWLAERATTSSSSRGSTSRGRRPAATASRPRRCASSTTWGSRTSSPRTTASRAAGPRLRPAARAAAGPTTRASPPTAT